MTVKQLKAILEGQHDNDIVVLAKDAEGNDFSPLAEATEQGYQASTKWSAEQGYRAITKWSGDIRDMNAGGMRAVVLWPVN